MSEDLIRRSDAIKAIEPYLDYIEIIPFCGAKPYVREAVCGIRSKIKFIPTIEPKQGEWIDRSDGGRILNPWWETYECSKCGQYGTRIWHFCPNCGADMRPKGDDDV